MSTLHSINQIAKSRRNIKFYQNIEADIIQAGYASLEHDSDSRIQEAWRYFIDNNIHLNLIYQFDFDNNMRNQTDKYYRLSQPRTGSTDHKRVIKFFNMFYKDNKKQNKICIVINLAGIYYVLFGNHRAEAHRMAMRQGFAVNECVLEIGHGLSLDEKRLLASNIAGMSNKDTDDDVKKLDREEHTAWVESRFEVECDLDPSMLKFTLQQKKDWAEKALQDNFPVSFDGLSNNNELARVVNLAFSPLHQTSIDFPDQKQINVEWQKHFPKTTWDPVNQKNIIQKDLCTSSTVFDAWLGYSIRTMPITSVTQGRPEAWFTVRVGEARHSTINRTLTVTEGREKYLEFLKKYNINMANTSGAPIITKVLFVQQLHGGTSESFIWNTQTLEFDKVP